MGTAWQVVRRVGMGAVGGILALVASAAGAGSPVMPGEHLANHVAVCVQCHSPRNGEGELDRTRLFRGAPIPVRSPFAAQTWAVSAPAIAGLPGWTTEDALALLTTGRRLSGFAPKPPMPPFRLSRDEAEAVIRYLRSLR